jgi:hypothetical protein
MSKDLYYDLSAAVNLQKNYVDDLSSIYNKNADNAADIAVQLNNIQGAISKLSSEYDKANSSSDSVLHHQQEMMKILQIEQQRLLQKKELFDQVEAENERKVLLNDTYRKKYTQYTKITIVVIMVLIALVIIRLTGKYITVFPESLYNVLMIVVISIGIIYSLILYADMAARSNINYDEIEVPPPKLDASGNLIVNSPAGKSIWSAFDTCSGSKCCSIGTSWNDQLSLCVVEPYAQGGSLGAQVATTAPITTSPAPVTTTASATTPSVTTPSVTTLPAAKIRAKKKKSDSTTTPPVTTPPVTTPPVTTPPVTTPPVTTPPVTTPPVTTPPVTTPPVTTPPVTTPPVTTPPATRSTVSFTTMAQAVAYGDINQNTKIIPSTINLTNAWMGDTTNVKPNAYLEYNQFQKI